MGRKVVVDKSWIGKKEAWCFVVDLWGSFITGRQTAVHHPPAFIGMVECESEIVWKL